MLLPLSDESDKEGNKNTDTEEESNASTDKKPKANTSVTEKDKKEERNKRMQMDDNI